MRSLEAEDSDVPDNELIELVLRDVGLEYIPKCAIRVQKYYMRQPWGLYMGLNTSLQQFVERLNDLNWYLLYFPEENPKQLDKYEIIMILDQVKARGPEWHEAMVNADIDIFEMTYEDEIIKILNQAKPPEWHEAMVNANIDIFEMTYEESVSYFKRLENLEKIRRTNGPNPSSLPVDNKKSELLSEV
jgi:hypothetical protein